MYVVTNFTILLSSLSVPTEEMRKYM